MSPCVSGMSLDGHSQAGFFCRKFSGLQKTHPDHNTAVSEAGPALILERCDLKGVLSFVLVQGVFWLLQIPLERVYCLNFPFDFHSVFSKYRCLFVF